MKKLILLSILFIVGCPPPTEPEPEDCAGVPGGNAYLDDCGVCNGIADYVAGSCYDCADTPNGTAVEDDCGVCGGNNSPNTGICDCTGIPNGFAVDFGCGICIDYNSISFSKVNDYTSTSLLPTVCNYKNNFSDTYNTPAPDMESSYIFLDLGDNTNSIIISAPHAQRAYRYTESDNTHSRDLYTGAYAQILHDLTGMPTIIAKYKSDDPNYYDYIPSETVLYEDYIGEMIPYKEKLKEFIEDDSNNIMMVIDLHGSKNYHFERTWAIDIGTGDGQSLNSEIGECVPSIVTYIFEQYDIQISYDEVFAGWTNETVTRFIAQDINKNLDAMQFEMKRDYRGGCSGDTEYYPNNYFTMIMAFTELIFTMNYIYNSEIVTQ